MTDTTTALKPPPPPGDTRGRTTVSSACGHSRICARCARWTGRHLIRQAHQYPVIAESGLRGVTARCSLTNWTLSCRTTAHLGDAIFCPCTATSTWATVQCGVLTIPLPTVRSFRLSIVRCHVHGDEVTHHDGAQWRPQLPVCS